MVELLLFLGRLELEVVVLWPDLLDLAAVPVAESLDLAVLPSDFGYLEAYLKILISTVCYFKLFEASYKFHR